MVNKKEKKYFMIKMAIFNKLENIEIIKKMASFKFLILFFERVIVKK